MKSINRLNIAYHLAEYQLNMIGKTLDAEDNWLTNYTLTQEQHDKFRAYAIPLLKKVFKFNTNKAKSTFEFFNDHFGLKVKE